MNKRKAGHNRAMHPNPSDTDIRDPQGPGRLSEEEPHGPGEGHIPPARHHRRKRDD
jgi:hypothetical protein